MFLGLDIGTSGVKAVLVDDQGALAAQATAPLTVSRPRPGWSEQDPESWWLATERAVQALDPTLRHKVLAIGLSGQMHGATLLGADRKPLRPAILWNDGRSGSECAALEQMVPMSRGITGNLAMPGFTAPKLLWLAAHEPDIFAAVKTVLLPKDYVRLCMTGDLATDLSDAAGTLWVDVAERDWSDTMLSACRLTRGHMPGLYEGTEITGTLAADTASRWGMDRVPVVAGAGDNAAGAAGVGVVNPGDAFLSLGTSGVLFVANDTYRPNPDRGVHTFCHCLPDRWHQMSVILSAASAVDWAARMTGFADAAALIAAAEQRARLDNPLIFLPYLSGERTPHNDPDARGVLFGLDHDSDAAAVGQAVLEGVAFAFADGLQALFETGTTISSLTVIGGGARSRYWGRILAAALGRKLVYRDGAEVGPAFGAARLARIGLTGEAVADVCTVPPVRTAIEPDSRDSDMLAAKRNKFARLYKDLRGQFKE
ncbi:MAG: xylulokinase [Alphaproteobacteria bacterium]|nr:MAG: xylulokinase [Alphaproteobacteria bacterium]